MPELWIPYGSVETLVTIQAENLGALVDPQPERPTIETERLLAALGGKASLFVCDSSPPTVEFLRELSQGLPAASEARIFSAAPRRIETAIPGLKGRLTTLPPPVSPGDELTAAEPLQEEGSKVFLATPRPDPLFGIVDARVQACLNWVTHARREAAKARREMEPTPFEKTSSKDAMDRVASGIGGSKFVDVMSRGGRVHHVLEDAPFDAIRGGFLSVEVPPAKAIVVGSGGTGFDDTLSSAVRAAWSALSGVRRSGYVLLMAECSEGLGSTALEMAATGRITGDGVRRKDMYVDGIEDILYLSKLREEYDVLLLSGLPEVYAKSKLGLTTARGAGEAVGRLLNKLGRTGKANVITRAGECRLESP